MLLSFRVANHRSIRDEQQLLLTPQYQADLPKATGRQAVPVAGIFGPNAAGKSNIIDGLSYMQGMVLGSLRKSEPGEGVERHPFELDPDVTAEPSMFVIDLLIEGVRYTYGFAVDDREVIEEWLHSYPNQRKRKIFHRDHGKFSYGENSPPSMQQVATITDSNVLFISVAARSNQELVQPVYSWFSHLHIRSHNQPTPKTDFQRGQMPSRLHDDEFRGRLTALLRAADTGIEGLEITQGSRLASLAKLFDITPTLSEEEFLASLHKRIQRSDLLEATKEVLERSRELVFKHRGAKGAAVLKLSDQSLGTQALYSLAFPILQALDSGSAIAVDELDASLHPYLSAKIIKMFGDSATNPRGAQLIFTSHDASLLGRIQGREVLRRDHIWFVEKDESGATELFPLSDFKPRKEENRERRYLTGRYGAVPIVNDELFAAALAARGEARDEPPETRPEEIAPAEPGDEPSP